jgi:hypothetical protein
MKRYSKIAFLQRLRSEEVVLKDKSLYWINGEPVGDYQSRYVINRKIISPSETGNMRMNQKGVELLEILIEHREQGIKDRKTLLCRQKKNKN